MSTEAQQGIAIYQLSQRVVALETALNETRQVVNALAALHKLEWVKEIGKLVSKEKLDALKAEPR